MHTFNDKHSPWHADAGVSWPDRSQPPQLGPTLCVCVQGNGFISPHEWGGENSWGSGTRNLNLQILCRAQIVEISATERPVRGIPGLSKLNPE